DTTVAGAVSVIDTGTNTVAATVPTNSDITFLAVSPNSRYVYVTYACSSCTTTSSGGGISVIDTATDTVAKTFSAGGDNMNIAVSPDGRRMYVEDDCTTTSCSGVLMAIDTETDAVLNTVPLGYLPGQLGEFVGPGSLIAFNSQDQTTAGGQASGSVQAVSNSTGCPTEDSVVEQPLHGTLNFDRTGDFVYTPTAGYDGPDSFTWRAQAAGCTAADAPVDPVSNVAAVSLTVSPAAVAPAATGGGGGSLGPFTLIVLIGLGLMRRWH
ncbi:MAG: Ig-like domain-containing protein, partial [Gammaproteobacteria bacterium]